MTRLHLLTYTALAVFMSAVLAWGLSAQTAHPATATPLATIPQPVTLPRSMILSNEDEHGCSYIFFWDASKSLCTIHMHFQANVVCKMGKSGSDIVCSYKPKPAEVEPKK